MSFEPRSYEAVVRDLLSVLTGGTVRESLVAPPEGVALLPQKLRDRPVRRISFLEGRLRVGKGDQAREIDYRFTDADFELVASGSDDEKDSIRFRDGGRRPLPGTTLTVNYYPVRTDPVPIDDVNVGSVARTLMETFARELALSYLHLERVYDSAFVETAEQSSLDKVTALVGVKRLPQQHPVTKLRFSRAAGSPGRITVPIGTAVTDDEGNRYLTLAELTLEPNETTREVPAAGESQGTAVVDAGKLDRVETLIAGVSAVTNPSPARQLSAPETDDELRTRAKSALHGAVRGTVEALRFGLLSIREVKTVSIVEAPNGVPGEIRVEVAYHDDTPAVRALVAERIEELRPAGIRVVSADASSLNVAVRVALVLAGSSLPDPDLSAVKSGVSERIEAYLAGLAPGGVARRAKLAKLALEDDRVVDAQIRLVPDSREETDELGLNPGQVMNVEGFEFAEPAFESVSGPAPASVAVVSALLPVHLAAGVTAEQATSAIQVALESHLASRGVGAPLTVDGVAAAIRDDSRFALVRADVLVTVEAADRFFQLTDGAGSYALVANQTLELGEFSVVPQEGGV